MFGFKKENTAVKDDLIPCQTGEELLKNEKIANYVSEIKQLSGCATDVFNGIYRKSLLRLAEYCQMLPYGQYAHPERFGFLERQLKLAISTLKLRRGKLFPKNAGAEKISHDEGMWTYAIFSVAIMHGLFNIKNQVTVYLKNKNGEQISNWEPLSGSLYEEGFYYQWHFGSLSDIRDDRFAQGVILGKIAPLSVFKWLHSSKTVFEEWYNAIINNRERDNEIITLIDEAAEKAGIQLYFPTPFDEESENIHEEVKEILSNDFFNVDAIT